ncbi:SAM-dependent methyltransferase [Sphingomonas sp. F9_3S_D5_B_2]
MIHISTDNLELEDVDLERRLELMRGPTGVWQGDQQLQARMLERLGLQPEHQFLEIGCGPLQIGTPLIRYLEPGHYTGVDISPERIAAARDVAAHFNLLERQPQLIRSDDFGLDQLPTGTFDRLWSFNVVIHFPLRLVERFMEAAATLLKPDGIGWFSAWVTPEGTPFNQRGSWLEFPVTEAGPDFFQSLATKAGLKCVSLGTLQEWGLGPERPSAKNWLFEISRPNA